MGWCPKGPPGTMSGMRTKLIACFTLVVAGFAFPIPSGAHHNGMGGHIPRIGQFTALDLKGVQTESAQGPEILACTPRTADEANQADVGDSHQTQIIYFVPQGVVDECLDQDAAVSRSLVDSFNSLNAWYVREGIGALRLDRTSSGAMDIPFIRGNNPASSYTGVSSFEAELNPYLVNNKRFIIFAAVDRGGVCGQAEWPGRFAAFFLDSTEACGVRDFGDGTLAGAGAAEVVAGHEILHNEGAVSLVAPNSCTIGLLHYGHICTPGGILVEFGRLDPESVDMMFPYAIFGFRLGEKVLDRNRDDYYQTSDNLWPFALVDLANSPYFL